MTDDAIRRALAEAAREVLEKMFFVLAAEESGPPSSVCVDEDTICVRLAFEGEPPGFLHLRLDAGAARPIAADFLGVEPADISTVETGEVVREMANMICGSVLSRLESSTTFQLDAPEIFAIGQVPVESSGGGGLVLDLGNGRMAVSLSLDSTRCPKPVLSAS